MEIIYLNQVDSTQKYLKNYIKKFGCTTPIAIVTSNQIDGIGSRDNKWIGEEGNLFFSFAIHKIFLPSDLPAQSVSIYFSYLFKELLNQYDSKVWLKWPNDFYINSKKIGGTITNLQNDLLLCGIGLNLKYVNNDCGYLDITLEIDSFLKEYFNLIYSKITWKKIFSKYTIEFNRSKHYNTTVNNHKVSLKSAILNDDGSIDIHNKKVFSLR